jgi:transposase-like protein
MWEFGRHVLGLLEHRWREPDEGELRPAVWHHVERYANNRVEADRARLKRWLRPMRGIKTMAGLPILAAGHALVQDLRRGHHEIVADQPRNVRLAIAFGQIATAV